MSEAILFVDDEAKILEAYRRTLRKSFKVVPANSGKQALELMESEGPFPVIVSDMKMPEMNGVELLSIVKQRFPNTIRLMLTGNADQQTAVSAINTGDVYRFLNKPCPPDQMTSAINSALDYYRLLKAEQELLENTVKGSIKALVEILSIVSPKIFGHAAMIRNYVVKCADILQLQNKWELEAAALLGQIGTVTLPEAMLERALKGSPLNQSESALYDKHPQIGAELINKIPRLEGISAAIRYQNKNYDGSGKPDDEVSGSDIPLGARILKPVTDLVAMEKLGATADEAFARLRANHKQYDPQIIEAIKSIIKNQAEKVTKEVPVIFLTENMIIAEDIITKNGALLMSKGQTISPSMIVRLVNFSRNSLIQEKVNVLVNKN